MKKTVCSLLILLFSFAYSYAGGRYSFSSGKGYRGFLDFGYTIGIGNFKGLGRLDLSTSHGYQFNPYFFLGAGIGYQHCDKVNLGAIPVFIDSRFNLMKRRITPFLGLKAGYSFDTGNDDRYQLDGPGYGFYFVPSVGARLILRKNLAVNLSVGYTRQVIDYAQYLYNNGGDYSDKESWDGISIKAGIEF